MNSESRDRGIKIRMQLDQMINQFASMEVGTPLTWLYIWDVIKYKYDYYNEDSGESYVTNSKFTLDDVWDEFWQRPVFSLEYGTEQLDDNIFDWLVDKDFIIENEG
jgi:hypothetical protein